MTKEEQLVKIDEIVDKLHNNNYKVYFLMVDTKGNPSSSIEYMYQIAYKLFKAGKNVIMAYVDITENDTYVGPFSWLDKKYQEIPYTNVMEKNVTFGPEDFVFVPEILSDALIEMKGKVRSKRILVVNDYKRLADFYPVMTTMDDLRVYDCITTTKAQADKIDALFPNMRFGIIPPAVENKFRPYDGPKRLMVNVIAKNPSDRNRIVKEFYWKYPIYRWVSFNDLRGLNQDSFSEALRMGDITIWVDDNTEFGLTALEALKCGNMVLAKVPENPSEWMETEDGELTKTCLWFRNIDEVSEMISSIVRSWTLDKIPEQILNRYKAVENLYTNDVQDEAIKQSILETIITHREKEFNEFGKIINSKND